MAEICHTTKHMDSCRKKVFHIRNQDTVRKHFVFKLKIKFFNFKINHAQDRFNDDDEMYAWGGTLENIREPQQNYSYQNSGLGKQMIDFEIIRNADAIVASNPRQ